MVGQPERRVCPMTYDHFFISCPPPLVACITTGASIVR